MLSYCSYYYCTQQKGLQRTVPDRNDAHTPHHLGLKLIIFECVCALVLPLDSLACPVSRIN